MHPWVGHLFWDELLMFVVPVLLVLAAVRWAERRRPPDRPDGALQPTGIVIVDSTSAEDAS